MQRLGKTIAGLWLGAVLVFVAALAGLTLVSLLVPQLSPGLMLAALIITALLVTLIVEISRYRTLQKLELMRLQVETSGALGQEITANPDFDALLLEIVELLKAEFKYDFVGIGQLDTNQCLTRLIQVGRSHLELPLGSPPGEDTPFGVASSGRFVLTALPEEDDAEGAPRMRSQLVLPLTAGQQLQGLMIIRSRDATAFDADHILVLQALATQTATAIRNALLYQREASRRHLAETLYDIGLALSGTLNREEVLGNILDQLATIVPYERASLLLQENNELEIVAARGFPPGSEPLAIRIGLNPNDDDDIYFTINRTRRPLIVPDISTQKNWQHVDGLPRAKSWIGVPLLHNQKVIGMLSLVRESDVPYSDDDTAPATTFAVQAAVALHNAELYNQIDEFNKQLSYEVEQRTEAVIQLSRLDQAKSDFINVAAHELRTPLTTIQGYSQMLMQEKEIAQHPYQHELVDGIFKGADRLHDIVNNMLSVAKIDNQSLNLHFQAVSLEQLLERLCSSFRTTMSERSLTLERKPLTHLPDVQADLSALRLLFRHLMMNAIKYTPDGGQLTITGQVIAEMDGETAVPAHVEIVIADTGIGIPKDAQDLIFNKFYQTGEIALHSSGRSKFKGGGPGLGLAIVRGIVEAHHGQVWVESAGYSEQTFPGSQFHVKLPIRSDLALTKASLDAT